MRQGISEEKKCYVDNAIRSLYQLIVLVDEDGCLCEIIDCNDELSDLDVHGIKNYTLLFARIYKNIHPEEREEFDFFSNVENISRELEKQIYVYFDCRVRHKDSRYYWTRITITNAREEDSTSGNVFLFLMQDIGYQKKKEMISMGAIWDKLYELQEKYDRLYLENMTDQHTGCFNRKGLKYYENIVMNEVVSTGKKLLTCVLDLNGLKHMNDTYGHKAGDEAIKAVADALREAMPNETKIVRTGGDEFLCIGAFDDGQIDCEKLGSQIDKYLDQHNINHNNNYEIAASYGFVFRKCDTLNSLDDYIEEADRRMYLMKEKRIYISDRFKQYS